MSTADTDRRALWGSSLAMALLRLGIEVEWIKPREDAKPAY
jgi:hypothetical protein